jgi:hypothetical protein
MTIATAPSLSWQQSSRRRGSTDPAAGLVLGQRDRLAVEEGRRIGGGEVARRHGETRPKSSLVAP